MLLRTAFLSISIFSASILLAQTSDGCDGVDKADHVRKLEKDKYFV